MKRIIFYTLVFLIACIAGVHAQTFVPTYGTPCTTCVPTGYEKVSGAPTISNPTGVGGNAQNPWYDAIPNPPTSQTSMNLPSGQQKSFMCLKNGNASNDKVQVTVDGFVQGQKYTMNYALLSLRTPSSNYGSSGTVTVSAPNGSIFGSRTTSLNGLINKDWVYETVSFTALSTTLVFTFSSATANGNSGYVGFDIDTYAFDCILPTDQVVLKRNVVTTRYACESVALNGNIASSTPPKAVPVWQKASSPDAGGNSASSFSTGKASANPYYAFYYAADMKCFNTTNSTAALLITKVDAQVSIKQSSITNKCPYAYAELSEAVNFGNSPYNGNKEEIRWFKNNSHQGLPVDNSQATSPGDYYTFFYNFIDKCYSVDISTAKVTVSLKSCPAGTAQVALSSSTAVNTCPATTVNLNNVAVTNQPPLTSLVWFTDQLHQNKVADPSKAGAGTYYAFFTDNATGDFNTHFSTSALTVTINPCETKVNLNLKVFLQGATTQENGVATMRNDLQKFPTSVSTYGLLPTQDPYGGGEVFADINSLPGEDKIVDWVKVEIRSMQNPAVILESKSLLLRSDGSVVDKDGFAPKFSPQFGGVRIAVKHRNHLGVLGLGIVSFNAGTVNYDFSTSLSKAYNVGAPAQMVLTSGVWCMPMGDVQQDYAVDNVDYAIFDNSFNNGEFGTYSNQDLNLDGLVDNVDYSFFDFSFNSGFFSTLINY
ncbi:hypothetical protein [Dyadobacter chenhuakuii]|uniref:Carbohydrate binding protein n=1 Tax=Dyadobacter chenhuakuii TaxID=2909339 RepID=A0A9X1QD07_9BACT|nr:hypothetical protein [Dyadobacter chenhuakuii]MCF2499603.1 hypothetical protein [Dyadobacter chenhuakuii]